MRNSQHLWDLYQTSKAFNTRPSDMLDVDDRFAAFCLDRACFDFGNALEAELGRVEGKNQKEIDVKADRLLRKWLDLPLQYRDPATSGHIELPKKGED